LNKTADAPAGLDRDAEFIRYVLLDDGAVKWHEFNHPIYGKIEIGGFKKNWGRVPPSFLLEEECHRNMAFTLYHADQMPRLNISEIKTEKIDEALFKIWITVENQRLIPTRTAQDIQNHISPPDVVSLTGRDLKVLSAGRVTDRFFQRVEAVKRRPERVEMESVGGLGTVRVQFVVSGHGPATLTVDSAKGGFLEKSIRIQ
jgi:hypothetical protein